MIAFFAKKQILGISQNQRLGYYKCDFLESRLDELIAHYGIKDAGKRREIYRVI